MEMGDGRPERPGVPWVGKVNSENTDKLGLPRRGSVPGAEGAAWTPIASTTLEPSWGRGAGGKRYWHLLSTDEKREAEKGADATCTTQGGSTEQCAAGHTHSSRWELNRHPA